MSENTPTVKVKEITPEQAEKLKENFSKLLQPFRVEVSHKDDDGNEGETTFLIEAPTILGALSCLENFPTFRDSGWKAIVVQELFDEAERDMVNPAEVDRRVTERVMLENVKTFREGSLTLNYTYNHPFLKGGKTEALVITYKYNQLLHLIQMTNTVFTDKFSDEMISSINKGLDSAGEPKDHAIKL